MEWLFAIIALIAGLVIGWWLAKRANEPDQRPTTPRLTPPIPPEDLPLEDDPAPDDLRRIEGVGPKIAERLNMGGIYTYAELAATPVDRLRDILDGAGGRMKLADPSTWPEQARLAAAADWDELRRLQDQLQGGRR